jgi:uncharacterized protein
LDLSRGQEKGHVNHQNGILQTCTGIVEVWPILDHGVIEPAKAIAAICEIISQPGLHAKFGANRRLAGPVPISDSEFSAARDGLALNGVVTGVIMIVSLWFPMRSVRLVAAIAVNLAAGLGEGP